MAVRYSQQLTNIADEVYRVDLLDGDFGGSSAEFILADFETDWKGQQNDRSNFLIGSSCTVIAQSTTSSNLDTLISDIIGAEEGRFQIAIYKKVSGSFVLWWWGIVLNDLSGGTDESPTTYTITATDGLGILKGVEYQSSGNPIATQTASATLMTALQNIPYDSFFAATDHFLHTRVNWFESAMAATTGDPAYWTYIPETSFYTVDTDGNYTFKSCYEVIETICNLFKARLMFANGVWRFYQVFQLENKSSFTYFRYQYNKAQVSGTALLRLRKTLSGGFSGGTRLSTQTFENFAPLRKVTQKYIHDTSDNLIKGITFNDTVALTSVISSVTANGSAVFQFAGSIQTYLQEIVSSGTATAVYVKVRMTIKNGIYYLKRTVSNQTQNNDYTFLSWSTTASYVEFISVQTIFFSGGNSIAVNFTTPAILSASEVKMQIEKVYVQDLQQNNLASNYTTQITLQNPYLEFVDGDGENEREYTATNSITAFFSDTFAFPDINTADRINALTPNNLTVWNGSAQVESTGTWGRGTISGNKEIISLGLKEFIGGQRTAIKKRQGDFVGKFEMYNVLGVSSEFFLFLGVQYSANDARFSGDWYKVGTNNISGVVSAVKGLPLTATNLPDAPSVSPPNNTGTATLPTNVRMSNGQIIIDTIASVQSVIINDASGSRNIVLDGNGHSYTQGSLALGTDTQNASAMLELNSTTKGLLLPRMTAAQRADIGTPATGLLVYQTDSPTGLYVYNGSAWDAV